MVTHNLLRMCVGDWWPNTALILTFCLKCFSLLSGRMCLNLCSIFYFLKVKKTCLGSPALSQTTIKQPCRDFRLVSLVQRLFWIAFTAHVCYYDPKPCVYEYKNLEWQLGYYVHTVSLVMYICVFFMSFLLQRKGCLFALWGWKSSNIIFFLSHTIVT